MAESKSPARISIRPVAKCSGMENIMRNFKKLAALSLVGVLALCSMSACGSKDSSSGDKVKIGIGQFAEHGSLDNCREGFIEGLKQEGYEDGKNVTFYYENAQADGSMANQISTNFISKKVDLVCGIATPMAQSLYATASSAGIPTIFTAVTDPVVAEFASEDGTPKGEITGTSDKLAVSEQLEMIKKITPDVKKIGILYCTSEVNSLSAIEEYKSLAGDYGFKIVEKGVSAATDVPLATDALLGEVDCINNLTDNTVVTCLPTIIAKANAKNIPVFGSEIEQVKKGCLATVGLDYYELGIQTGKMAAKVLKGEKKASEIKFETITEAKLYINSAVADNLKVTIADDVKGEAEEIFDSISE